MRLELQTEFRKCTCIAKTVHGEAAINFGIGTLKLLARASTSNASNSETGQGEGIGDSRLSP